MIINRRQSLILAAAAATASAAGLGPARADDQVTIPVDKLMASGALPDHVLGNKDAKVTVIEYGSAECPHCGRFHRDVYPDFKKKYIDTNKVAFIFRPFPLNIFDVAIFTLAEIAGDANFYKVIDTFYDNQDKWDGVEKESDAIKAIALQLGFTEDSYKQALTNQDWPKRIQQSATTPPRISRSPGRRHSSSTASRWWGNSRSMNFRQQSIRCFKVSRRGRPR